MALIEQLICGMRPESPDSGFSVLSHSPGVGVAVQEEIMRHCRGWGEPRPGGLARPAVISFPLNNNMPAMRGQLVAVVRVSTGDPPCFHAVIMTKLDFRSFECNPLAVIAAGSFLGTWSGGGRLARGQIEPTAGGAVFSPPPNPGDVGLVDEALQLFLTKGKLVMNLESATAESDRALGLVIQTMPPSKREKLRFTTFAPHGENTYDLAAVFAKETPFSSWQRLFMTMIDQGTSEPVRQYVAKVRNGLAAGFLEEINQDSIPEARRPARLPVEPSPVPRQPVKTREPVSNQAGRAGVPFSANPPGQVFKSAASAIVPAMNRGAGPGRVMAASQPSWRPVSESGKGPTRTRLVSQPVSLNRRGARRKSPALFLFLVTMISLAGGWYYLEHSGKGREWGLFDLANRSSRPTENTRAASLLDVVDVGREYDRQLARLNRAKLVPGMDGDQARLRAQADLLADVAGPLLVQVELFLDLTGQGIQQGRRPDREKERLRSLDNQGQVLVEELGRLELAYFSLQGGILWQDLNQLSAAGIQARRDSLMKSDKREFTLACQDVGSPVPLGDLVSARANVRGMARLLALFQETAWSEKWEREMKLAAEKVSPSASAVTRAYRNNAFTLVRFKHAEHNEAGLDAVFGAEFTREKCFSPAVLDILPDLRRRAALFAPEEIPELLVDILALYRKLEDPQELARQIVVSGQALADLRSNGAFRFDPQVYENYLSRVRFEALAGLLEQGLAPEDLPDYLTEGFDLASLVQFFQTRNQAPHLRDWAGLAAMAGDSFLGRWAGVQETQALAERTRMQESLALCWQHGQVHAQELRQRAAKGQDWTAVWADLNTELESILATGQPAAQEDSALYALWSQAAGLEAALNEARPLDLERVVVRLEQDVLTGPGTVQVEFLVEGAAEKRVTAEVRMGPAAPEDTGWVGTADLDWSLLISPKDRFTSRVLQGDSQLPLLEVHYPSLRERVGPGALVRPRRGKDGALAFVTGDRWWREVRMIEIP